MICQEAIHVVSHYLVCFSVGVHIKDDVSYPGSLVASLEPSAGHRKGTPCPLLVHGCYVNDDMHPPYGMSYTYDIVYNMFGY